MSSTTYYSSWTRSASKKCSVEGTTAIAALDQVFSSNEEDEATQKRLANLRELLQGRMLRRLKDDV